MAESKSSRGQKRDWGEGIEACAPTPRRRSRGPVPGKDLAQRGTGTRGAMRDPLYLKSTGVTPSAGVAGEREQQQHSSLLSLSLSTLSVPKSVASAMLAH
ncbi:hypothetical protein CGRA01v4_11170 [Colletotrichum graminicola]|nr:hypothetical protein CGRA01v4_11170 [Colletotrichum graminicola]